MLKNPLEAWAPLPDPIRLQVRDSLAPAAVKALFDLWGATEGDYERGLFAYSVQPEDLSVSSSYTNADGDYITLSLSADGLSLRVTANGEEAGWRVEPQLIADVSLYDQWGEYIVLP